MTERHRQLAMGCQVFGIMSALAAILQIPVIPIIFFFVARKNGNTYRMSGDVEYLDEASVGRTLSIIGLVLSCMTTMTIVLFILIHIPFVLWGPGGLLT